MRLMPQRMPSALLGLSVSGGPNMASTGHHQRFTASCTISRCAGVPFIIVIRFSKPWRWWKLSSLQMRIMARAYGPVGAAADRHLVHDRRAVHQPADGADVGPGQGRVVEDRAVLGLAAVQRIEHLVAARAQRFGGRIEIQAVAAFVLHLGQQDGLALERGRARNPVALGQHADDFAVGVLADLAHQGLAVGLGHPVLRLDLAVAVDLAGRTAPGAARPGRRRWARTASPGLLLGLGKIQGLGVHRTQYSHSPTDRSVNGRQRPARAGVLRWTRRTGLAAAAPSRRFPGSGPCRGRAPAPAATGATRPAARA